MSVRVDEFGIDELWIDELWIDELGVVELGLQHVSVQVRIQRVAYGALVVGLSQRPRRSLATERDACSPAHT